MLEQEIPPKDQLMALISAEVDYLTPKIVAVAKMEWKIDPDKKVYLFTWSPDPSEGPDADFETQHMFWYPAIVDFLNSVEVGIACVEASQLGNPHYHGWYQVSDDPIKERLRCVHIKVMARFAPNGLRITSSKGHMKFNSYVAAANCLHYYKKDLLQSMSYIATNPITAKTKKPDHIDWNNKLLLFRRKCRETINELEDKISLKDFYKQFYQDSL